MCPKRMKKRISFNFCLYANVKFRPSVVCVSTVRSMHATWNYERIIATSTAKIICSGKRDYLIWQIDIHQQRYSDTVVAAAAVMPILPACLLANASYSTIDIDVLKVYPILKNVLFHSFLFSLCRDPFFPFSLTSFNVCIFSCISLLPP